MGMPYPHNSEVPFSVTVLSDADAINGANSGNVSLDTLIQDIMMEGTVQNPINGWAYAGEITYKDIFGHVLEKGKHKIYYTNEDQYESVCGVTATFWSKKKDALKEFCKDWGFTQAIKKDKKVWVWT